MAAEIRAGTLPSSPPHAPSIRQIYAKLPARDVERARAFYTEKLGLVPFAEHNRHLRYELDGGYFIVFPSSGAPSGNHDQLGLVVEDIDGAVAGLQAKGVVFEDYESPPRATRDNGITDLGGVRAAWFKDSEGNRSALPSSQAARRSRPSRNRALRSRRASDETRDVRRDGTVGSEVLTQALDTGHDVRGLVSHAIKASAPHPRLTVVRGDVRDLAAVKHTVDGCDAVLARSARPTSATPICATPAPATSSLRCASTTSTGSW